MSSGHASPAAIAVSLVQEPGAARNAAELGVRTERKRIAAWLSAKRDTAARNADREPDAEIASGLTAVAAVLHALCQELES